ncbi:hypothetical protein [Parasphingorhabdus halotolerans]|uniref:Uncharacterized protein n=1 Tax=Parasphingorhabdus halotolerans TaxID=2725558 RepID=A0A6H2DGU1_9SPHN|nr:hypothetical protein [Parasphingorhabdus halotolerans]QJB67889.1 hypothetical protein HF685_13985 [Parasphingorhabdus halotolerans]
MTKERTTLKDFTDNMGLVIGLASGAALLTFFANFAGLDPPSYPQIKYVGAALSVACALIVWNKARNATVKYRSRMIAVCAILMIAGLLTYFFAYSLFVEPGPGPDIRIVRGYECTTAALAVFGNSCPDLPSSALADAQWDTRQLWTRLSVSIVEFGLVTTWLVFTTALIATIGAVIAGRK